MGPAPTDLLMLAQKELIELSTIEFSPKYSVKKNSFRTESNRNMADRDLGVRQGQERPCLPVHTKSCSLEHFSGGIRCFCYGELGQLGLQKPPV